MCTINKKNIDSLFAPYLMFGVFTTPPTCDGTIKALQKKVSVFSWKSFAFVMADMHALSLSLLIEVKEIKLYYLAYTPISVSIQH